MKNHLYLLLLLLLPLGLSAQLIGDTENGLASYFSPEYDGAETAYNVIYRKNELVAAHRQFPFNSRVRVKNIDTGKTVEVRIIDQGPFIRSRIIELSERAASLIGLLGKETVPVELTLLSTPGQPAQASVATPEINNDPVVPPATRLAPAQTQSPPPATNPEPDPITYDNPPTTAPPATVTPPRQTPPPAPTVTEIRQEVKTMQVSNNTTIIRNSTFAPGVYKINIAEPPAGTHGVQVGSFQNLEAAMDKITSLQSKWFDDILIERVNTGQSSVYKVILGPFASFKSAQRYASDLKKRYSMDGFAVPVQ